MATDGDLSDAGVDSAIWEPAAELPEHQPQPDQPDLSNEKTVEADAADAPTIGLAAAAATSAPTETHVIAATKPAAGRPGVASRMDVTNNGAFSYSYPIALPAFRDLEPKLELNYNSSRKTRTGGDYQGYLGYQWGLSGVPVIERAGYQLGVPQYVAEDVYLLNGEPLAKCAAGTASPGTSCKAGGNWVSEVENHLKIHFDGTAWMVTGRDGTVTTFTAVGQLPGAPAGPHPDAALNYHFLATSVVDVNGNRVDYSYDCVDLPVCYPKVISYNERAVEFFYDVRPDYLLDLASGAVAATFPGFNWTHLAGDAQAALRALSSVTNVKVISSPNLMVINNQQAKLQVGDQVPTITQTSRSTTSLPPISFVGSFRMRLFRSP